MSAGEEQTTAAEPEAEDVDEPRQMSERTAKIIVIVIAGAVMWGIVVAFPYIAYVVVGILCTLGTQKVRARWAGTASTGVSAPAEAEQPDVREALRRLIGDDKGVLLTVLRDDLKLPDTKAVKALLQAEGIPWKASRTREGNGPAVRAEAIPPASSPVADPHRDGCCCRSGDNSNSNNAPPGGDEKGIRVERTDTGVTIYDLLNFVAEAKTRPAKPSKGEVSNQ